MEDNLAVALAPVPVDTGLVAVAAGLPEADNRDNKEAASSSKAGVAVDTADVYPEVHTICSNRNWTPSTKPRHRVVSKSIGNIRRTIAHQRPRPASV